MQHDTRRRYATEDGKKPARLRRTARLEARHHPIPAPRRGIGALSGPKCFLGLSLTAPVAAIVGWRFIPLAKEFLDLFDRYPAMMLEPRPQLLALQLAALCTLGLLAGLATTAYGQRLVQLLMDPAS